MKQFEFKKWIYQNDSFSKICIHALDFFLVFLQAGGNEFLVLVIRCLLVRRVIFSYHLRKLSFHFQNANKHF